MTLVRNLRQQLSGNKKYLFFLFIFSLIICQSCFTRQFSKEQLDLQYEYSRKQKEDSGQTKQFEKPDSVQVITSTDSVITDSLDMIYPVMIKPNYKIAYVLPLYLDEIYDEEFKQKRISKVSQDYFMGARLALEDSVPKLGLNLHVQVYDNFSSYDSTVQSILYLIDNDSFDLIVGPFLSNHMSVFSSYSQEQKIPILSPFCIQEEFLENPYFISYRPTHKTHLEKSAQIIASQFKKYHIMVLSTKKTELDYIKDKLLENSDSTTFKSMNFMVVDESNWRNAEYLKYLAKDSNLLYVPSNNVIVINSIVTNLVGEIDFVDKDQKSKISILAPYAWLKKEAIQISMLDRLNAYFTSDPILDYSDSASIEFVKSYREKFKTEPGTYAWMGYQGVLFYAPLMLQYGRFFQRALVKNESGMDGNTYIQRQEDYGFEESTIWLFRFEEQQLIRLNY